MSELEYVPHARLPAIRIENAKVFISFYAACLSNRRNRPLIKAFLGVAEGLARDRRPPNAPKTRIK